MVVRQNKQKDKRSSKNSDNRCVLAIYSLNGPPNNIISWSKCSFVINSPKIDKFLLVCDLL